jgi:hypothetical protein
VESDEELACSQVTHTERLLHDTLASAGWDVLHPLGVSLKEQRKSLPVHPWLPLSFLNTSHI